MKILVLGSTGQLGKCLYDNLQKTNHEAVYASRKQIDVSNLKLTTEQILKIAPEVVINATAYTSVDKAEQDRKTADSINHIAVSNIADICKKLDCWLIHISTDYVFDGMSKLPYRENDLTNPQGIYGSTKLNGELVIQSSNCKNIIIRTSWVFSEYGNNFLKTILKYGRERDELSLVNDQIGCPTYAQDLARSIVKIVSKLNPNQDGGIYHYCGDHSCSWYDFGKEIFNHAKKNDFKVPSIVKPIKTTAYPTPARRPPFSVLDCSKIENDFEIYRSNWQKGIKEVIQKMKNKET